MIRRYLDGESFVMVFGSNEAGVHGKGAALHALRRMGATMGQGVGLSGLSWALPTKDAMMNVLAIDKVEKYFELLFADAQRNPDLTFQLTRIGCGLAGHTDSQMIDLVRSLGNIPRNVILPGIWRNRLNPRLAILAVVGSRDFQDEQFVHSHIDRTLAELQASGRDEIVLCSGGATGVDRFAESYATKHGLKMTVIEANWTKYKKPAGPLRNATLAWYASDVLAIRFEDSAGTQDMVKTSTREKLCVREIVVDRLIASTGDLFSDGKAIS